MKQIKNENYIVIQGWMINKLNLSGNDLLVYAIIYGFTQSGDCWFRGTREYLANWCNCTTRGIQKNLNNLVERKLLLKSNGMICKYKCNPKFFMEKEE